METSISNRISKKEVLYNNLLLLGLKPDEVLKTSKIDITKDCLDKENSKAVHLILYFLLQQICTEEELVNLKLAYPPRNLSEKIEFTNVVYNLLQRLEQDKKLPKNFIVGKSILEVAKGDQIISFLRFLSELCIKHEINQVYPAGKIPTLRIPAPKKKLIDPHDMNEIYHISSLLDEKSQLIKSIEPEKIQEAIQVCYVHIRSQRKKFFKRANNLFESYDEWKKKTELIIVEFLKQKDLTENLIKKRKLLKKELDPKYFTEMRALDRIPQVDLCNEVNKLLTDLSVKIKDQKIDLMLREFVDKADGKKIADILEISNFDAKHNQDQEKSYILNDLLQKFNGSLDHLKGIFENQTKAGGINKSISPLDELIAKKKKNIELLRQKRKEFLAL